MKKMILIWVALAAITMTNTAFSTTVANDTVTVIEPYVRAVPPGQTNSAAFMRLENNSDVIQKIVNASSPVCKVVELHTHVHANGMMKMRRIESLDIPAKGETVLQPGGLHIMLIGLHNGLTLDQKISLTLEFADGSNKTIAAPVRKIKMQDMMKKK